MDTNQNTLMWPSTHSLPISSMCQPGRAALAVTLSAASLPQDSQRPHAARHLVVPCVVFVHYSALWSFGFSEACNVKCKMCTSQFETLLQCTVFSTGFLHKVQSIVYCLLSTVLCSGQFKDTVTQNIFSLKSGPKGCKDLGNYNDLQK